LLIVLEPATSIVPPAVELKLLMVPPVISVPDSFNVSLSST